MFLQEDILKTHILSQLHVRELKEVGKTCKRMRELVSTVFEMYVDDFADGLTALCCYSNSMTCSAVWRRGGNERNERYCVDICINLERPSYKSVLLSSTGNKVAVIFRREFTITPCRIVTTGILTNETQLYDEIRKIVRMYPNDKWEIDKEKRRNFPVSMLTDLFPTVITKETSSMKEYRSSWWFTLTDWIHARLNPFKHKRDAKERLVNKFLNPYWFETRERSEFATSKRRIRCGFNDGKCFKSDVCIACYFENLDGTQACKTHGSCMLCEKTTDVYQLLCQDHFTEKNVELIKHVSRFKDSAGPPARKSPVHLELVGWEVLVKDLKMVRYRGDRDSGTLNLYYRNPNFETDSVFVEHRMIFNDFC